MEIKIKKLNDMAIVPTRGSEYAAGYDLYANILDEVTINPNQTVKIGTGLSFELPDGCFGGIVARSGLATKHGIAPANKLGVCDSDYRGEYIVALHNDSDKAYTVQPFDRIAQLIIMPFIPCDFIVLDDLTDTSRGSNGFGSTGKQ